MGDKANMNDTALYRTTRETGFSARVEPIWRNVAQVRKQLGFLGHRKERNRIKRLVTAINDSLATAGVDAAGWDREEGECICHLRVERLGFLEDLRRFAREGLPTNVGRTLLHLLGSREKHALYLPADLERPLLVSDGATDVPAGSSMRLAQELAVIDKYLQVEREFALARMAKANFINASEKDLTSLESKAMFDPLFWAKFGYVVMKKLTEASIESKLPIILS